MTDEADDRLGPLTQRWQDDKSPRVALQLAEEYRRQERYDEAADVLETSLAEHPRSISGRVALGRVLLEGGRDDRAADVLGEVIDTDATQLVATKLLVEAFIRLGRADDARERLRYYGLLNDSDPDIPELRRRIGELTADDPSSLDDTRAPGVPTPRPAVEVDPADDLIEDPVDDDDPFVLDAPVAAAPLEDDDPFDFLGPTAPPPPPTVETTPTPSSLDDDPFELSPPPTAPALDDDPLADVLDDTVGAVPSAAPALDPAPEPGTAPAELDDTPEPALAAETAPSVETEAPAATATLGQMYLRQGHLEDAEEIFRQVLDADPDHEGARAGLDQVTRRRAEAEELETVDTPELTAEALLTGDRPEGLTAKKRLILERYLERIRRSADA